MWLAVCIILLMLNNSEIPPGMLIWKLVKVTVVPLTSRSRSCCCGFSWGGSGRSTSASRAYCRLRIVSQEHEDNHILRNEIKRRLTIMWKATTPSSSVFERLIKPLPSAPTVIDLPVHWLFTKSPEIMSQYVPAGRHVCKEETSTHSP